jgi:hypothetical protein
VMNTVNGLSRLDFGKVSEALSNLGNAIGDLPKIGRLFRKGVAIMQKAFESLLRLIDGGALKLVKDKVEKLWNDFRAGEFTNSVLAWMFELQASREQRDEILQRHGLEVSALDKGSYDLKQLGVAFKETMSILYTSASAVSLAGTVLILVPVFGPKLTLLAASIYALILAATILIGMDYSDSGRLSKRVRGIREITNSVAG